MSTLKELNKNISKLIKEHMDLFHSFDHVYLFGSALDPSAPPNDIDILIIYTKYSEMLSNDLKLISDELEKASGIQVDLTALSIEEEKDTAFLERIKLHCLRLK